MVKEIFLTGIIWLPTSWLDVTDPSFISRDCNERDVWAIYDDWGNLSGANPKPYSWYSEAEKTPLNRSHGPQGSIL